VRSTRGENGRAMMDVPSRRRARGSIGPRGRPACVKMNPARRARAAGRGAGRPPAGTRFVAGVAVSCATATSHHRLVRSARRFRYQRRDERSRSTPAGYEPTRMIPAMSPEVAVDSGQRRATIFEGKPQRGDSKPRRLPPSPTRLRATTVGSIGPLKSRNFRSLSVPIAGNGSHRGSPCQSSRTRRPRFRTAGHPGRKVR